MDKLKPCAHCEHFAIDAGQIDKQGTFEICCSYCGSMMRGMDHEQLVEDWNRRPAPENKHRLLDTIHDLRNENNRLRTEIERMRNAAPENKPLTLEQLWQMDGEPVWIDDWFEDFHGWELSADASDYLDGRDPTQYGSQWLAYTGKPEVSE